MIFFEARGILLRMEDELKMNAKNVMVEMGKHVVPLILLPSYDHPPKDIISSGSGVLIDTGEKKLLVTCFHVWDYFKKCIQDCPEMVIGVVRGSTGEIVDISRCDAISSCKNRDLSVLDFSDCDIFDGSGKEFFRSEIWPPVPPECGESVVVLGFPGSEINKKNENFAIFKMASVIATASSVSERHVVVVDEEDNFEEIDFVPREAGVEFKFGGMSGGPGFSKKDGRWSFVGVLYEGEVQCNYIMFIGHSGFISKEGRVV